LVPELGSASEMTYIVSGGALNTTHSLTPEQGRIGSSNRQTVPASSGGTRNSGTPANNLSE